MQSLSQTVPRSEEMCTLLTAGIPQGTTDNASGCLCLFYLSVHSFELNNSSGLSSCRACPVPLYLLGLIAGSALLQLRSILRRRKGSRISVAVFRHHNIKGSLYVNRLPVHLLPLYAPSCINRLDRLLPQLCSDWILGLDCEWQPDSHASKNNR
jgi:hypothetical protein